MVNGETTVTINTVKDGKEESKVIMGAEAEAYLKENNVFKFESDMDGMEMSEKIDLDVDAILNDPELKDLDEATKAKIKKALENNASQMENEFISEPGMTTKVIVTKK